MNVARKLYIIDGHALIYAAYYAPISSGFTAPDGEPTKATLIFTTMLIKILREKQPDMMVVAMDAPGPTFRHEKFPEYKANRPEMPEDLPVQIKRIEDILQAMRIPIVRVPGYEADDIIGTITRRARKEGLEVVICSGDKDLEQLLEEGVTLYEPRKERLTTIDSLFDGKGLRPNQVVDVLALMGDTSDNIPGVPDVGPKTAQQWISKYGSMDELIAHADEIKGKRGTNLRKGLEQLALSRELATIDCNVPLGQDLQDFTLQPYDEEKLCAIFRRLSFHRLLEQLGLSAEGQTAQTPQKNDLKPDKTEYMLVETPDKFAEFLKKLRQQQVFALDTETTGLNPVSAELVGLSFCWQNGQGYYLPVKAPLGQLHLDWNDVRAQLKPLLENPDIRKIGQNIKYDIVVLRRAGCELQGVYFDTMVASYVLDSSRTSHSMDNLARDFLGHETIKLTELIGKGKKQLTFDMVDINVAAEYAAEDADITWRLGQLFEQQLQGTDLQRLFADIEMPLVEVLAEMEYNGIAVDGAWLRKMGTQLSKRMEEMTSEIHRLTGSEFNVDSPKQLADVLFNQLGLKSVRKIKTGESTDQAVLETLRWQHPVAELMLEYRQLSKLKNTYIDKLPAMICPETGRIHASFNQAITNTGRLSSSNPNLQNIPIRTELGQEIRRAFIAQDKDDVLLAADYSQIELRLLAHFSGDRALQEAFRSGQDIHRFVAAQVYDVPVTEVDAAQRRRAKAVNFGIIYGQTAYGLSRSIGISVEEAQKFIDDYFQRYPDIKQWISTIIDQAKKEGLVKTISGRRRAIPEIHSRNANRRRLGERLAVNTVVQGSAADLIKIAMINIYRRIRKEMPGCRMLLQVHDELVFELPREHLVPYRRIIRAEMTGAMELAVPLQVNIGSGPNWLECK